jgi:2-(1,2-epoxy-1,2-dihydrophenyl)acetyl-CoA isomerase
MSYEHILVSREDAVGRLILNRPEKLNAFAGRMRDEIAEGLGELAEDRSVRVIVITGAGRGFCSGADVTFLAQLLDANAVTTFESLLDAGREVVSLIRAIAVPVIASVNGAAAGGGLNLALSCDIRLASDRASFGQTFSRIGLAPDWGGIHFLPRLVGEAHAIELMMTGRMIGAEEALRIGLVNRVVPHDELAAETARLARELAAKPPASLRAIKEGIYASLDRSLSENLAFETEAQLLCFASADAREGVRAFFEKRTPEFKGE